MRIRHNTALWHLVLSLILTLSVIRPPATALGQPRQAVGLELVLLIDVSASVNQLEFRLQIEGLSAAFRDPAVREAVRSSGGIAVCVIQWAQQAFQYKSVDWMQLQDDNDALTFSGRIASITRHSPSGQTAIGNALMFAMNELNSNAYAGSRRVIDVSGDGRSNDGVRLKHARATVLHQGVTINGLAILNEVATLDEYYRDKLIGGHGSFVLTARDYTDFAKAIREKLEREMRSTPLAQRPVPGMVVEGRSGDPVWLNFPAGPGPRASLSSGRGGGRSTR